MVMLMFFMFQLLRLSVVLVPVNLLVALIALLHEPQLYAAHAGHATSGRYDSPAAHDDSGRSLISTPLWQVLLTMLPGGLFVPLQSFITPHADTLSASHSASHSLLASTVAEDESAWSAAATSGNRQRLAPLLPGAAAGTTVVSIRASMRFQCAAESVTRV